MPATRQSRTLAGRVTRTRGYPVPLEDPVPKAPTPRRSQSSSKPQTPVATISQQKSNTLSAVHNNDTDKELSDNKKLPKEGESYKEQTTPDGARRSGRQRTLSKRLQDMELGFGNVRKSSPRKAGSDSGNNEDEEPMTQVIKRQKVKCDDVSEPAAVLESLQSRTSPATLPDTADSNNTKVDGAPVNQACEGETETKSDVKITLPGITCFALLADVESSTPAGQEEMPCATLLHGQVSVEEREKSKTHPSDVSEHHREELSQDDLNEMTKEPSIENTLYQNITEKAEGAKDDDINIKQVEELHSSDPMDHDMETETSNLPKLDCGQSHHPEQDDGHTVHLKGDGTESDNHTPEDDSGRQMVMLEDGKPMLLTDADTIKTAADAVATLMQDGSEYAFNIRPHDIQNISMCLVKGRKMQTSVGASAKQVELEIPMPVSLEPNGNSVSRDPVKIKFVTINSPPPPLSPAPEKAQQATDTAPVHVEVLVQNVPSNGPATMLTPDGFFVCTMCKYKTDKKANWYKHKRKHSIQADRRPYQCSQCDHRAATSSNLKRHQLTHTSIKTYKCDQCEMHFRQKIHMERHIRYKHMKKDIKCQYCEYVCANYNPDLKVHMKRKHFLNDNTTRFKFQCAVCGFLAACSRDLKQHEKFHRRGPELKLYCEKCSFVTDCESRLKRHLLVHSKEKPFACSLCEYRGSQKEHVLRHMQKKHDVLIEHKKRKNSDEPSVTVVDSDEGQQILPSGESDADQESAPHTAAKLESTEGTGDCQDIENNTTGTDVVNTDVADSGEPVIMKNGQEQIEPSCDQSAHVIIDGGQADDTSTEQQVDSADTNQQGPVSQQESVSQQASTSTEESADLSADGSVLQMQPQFVIQPLRKKYSPSDYSAREKVFSCIHCTMKFAKLINLYKHLQVQHKDIQVNGPDDMHSCVWCDYQTNKKKNLLIHMRKHNYKEGEFMPSQQVYSCVVCNYCSNRRKALYAHMKKKHKVQIYMKADGTASCTIDDNLPSMFVPGSSTNTTKLVVGQQQGSVVVNSNQTANQPIKTLTKTNASGLETQMVMLELEPGMPPTAVEIAVPPRGEGMDHEAADAIEGLQALAEQVLATEIHPGQSDQTDQQQPELEQAQQTGPEVEGAPQLDEDQLTCEVAEKDIPSNIQLSEEQVLQLSSGDLIEVNGEMYKVEFTTEETS